MDEYDNRTRYDPGTMSRVDVDVHVEELEAQIMPSEGVSQKRRSNRNDKLFLGVLVLALIGLTIGLSLGRRVEKENKETKSISLPAPPPDLADVCSLHKITSVVGYDFCEELCEPAECCKLPVGHNLSCAEENEETCATYSAACEHLADPSEEEEMEEMEAAASASTIAEVPPAPINLQKECDPANIETTEGFMACEDACLRAECCYTIKPGESCYFNNDECKNYSPCMILHDSTKTPGTENEGGNQKTSSKIILSVQEEVVAHCAGDVILTETGMEHCREVCSPAGCCFVSEEEDALKTGTSATTSCLSEKSDFCHDYAACQVLYSPPPPSSPETTTRTSSSETTTKASPTSSSSTSKLQHEIKTACSEEERQEPGGLENCKSLCAPSYCCFDSKKSHKCSDVDCKLYAPCGFLHGKKAEMQPADKKSIDLACSAEYLADGDTSECEKQCHNGLCCFAKEQVLCPAECSDYASCHVLHKEEEVIDGLTVSIKAAVDKACSEDDLFVCELMCESGSCCFTSGDTHNCFDTNCRDYSSCSVLMGKNSGGGSHGKKPDSNGTDPPDVATGKKTHSQIDSEAVHGSSSVETASSEDDIDEEEFLIKLDVDGKEVDIDLDKKGDDVDVKIDVEEEIEEGDDEEDDEENGASATVDNVTSGKDKDDEDNGEIVRDKAQPKVSGNDKEEKAQHKMKDVVDDACISVYKESSKCQDVCAMGSCCFEDDQSNCEAECSAFESCSSVFEKKEVPVEDTKPATTEDETTTDARKNIIDVTCSEEALGLVGGGNACKAVCELGSCCFNEDEKSCNVNCKDYASCEAVYNNSNAIPEPNKVVREVITEACSEKSTDTIEGTQACEDICGSGACCFVSLVESCTSDGSKHVNCEDYKACSAIYGKPS